MESESHREAPDRRLTNQPWFEYREIFEDGRTYCGISAGKGAFHDIQSPSYAILTSTGAAFSVVKDRSVNSLVAKVNSAKLHHFLFQALPLDTVTDHVSPSYDLKILLENYAALKSLLCKIEAIGDDFHGSINEVRLFVRDFLLDNSIWSSFGMGHLYKLGILSASHWQDVQSWTAARNLDDIEQMLFPKSEARNKEIEIDSPTRSNSSYHDLNKQLWDTVKLGNYDLVQALLASQDRPVGVSSLTVVLIGGHLDIFWLFFEHGAGLSCKLLQWMAGPIYIAASRGYLEAVRSMVRRARIQNPFGVPAYPLRAAAAAGHIEIVGYFLSLGADIDAPWSTVSPLASAAENGHLAMVRYLVKMGAKLDDQTLVAAIERHDFPTAEFLLEHRALANSRDRKYLGKFPRPALTVAINENDIPIFQLLLEHGADVNGGLNPDDRVLLKPSFEVRAGNSPCQKPIFAAVYRNNLGFAQSLVRHGASITKAERKALLKVAKSGDNPELLNLILAIPIFDRSSPVSNSAYTPSVRPEIEKERKLEEPSRCRVLAEIKAKERWVFKQSLRESFLRSHNKFLDETSKPKTSYTLTVFASEIPLAQSVWKKGIASIRGLLSNQLPSTLMEVFSSIQVSYAMRFALDSGEPKITIGGQPDLSADLDRWRLVVPTDEQSLFDDIARAVWDKSYRTASCQVDWRYEQETLEYFQKLMTSLITASHASCIVGGGLDLGGERLIVIQERFAVLNQVAWENRKTTSLSTRQSLEEHYDLPGRHPQILDEWKPASPMVILLTATAFFVIIIAFLSVLHTTDSISIYSKYITTCATRGSLRRYCHILVLCLGLSGEAVSEGQTEVDKLRQSSESISLGSTLGLFTANGSDRAGDRSFLSPSSASGASSSDQDIPGHSSPQETPFSTRDSSYSKKMSRPRCPRCSSTFSTVSNVNKHMKTDCKYGEKIQFPCRNDGCKKQLTRASYRIAHEMKRCPFRKCV